MINIYKKLYNKDILHLSKNPRIAIMSKMANSLSLSQKNILDIGCYDGTFLKTIKNKNQLYGIEASDYGCKISNKKGIKTTQFFFDNNDLPYKKNTFDLVIAGEIIEHIYDTDQFLTEIKRILKKDGHFLISTPNIASFGRRLMLLFGINPIIETTPNRASSSGHIRYFTFKSLAELLKENGFEIIVQKSDIINFDNSGKIRNKCVPKFLPSLGQSIIMLCRKSI